jgi:hypothetical protein
VARLDPILEDGLSARVDEDLHPAGGLPERDRLLLRLRERRVEFDAAERVQGHGNDRDARGEELSSACMDLDPAVRPRDRGDRRA